MTDPRTADLLALGALASRIQSSAKDAVKAVMRGGFTDAIPLLESALSDCKAWVELRERYLSELKEKS